VKVRETTYVYMERYVEVKKFERREVIRLNMMRERMEAGLKAANLPIPDVPTEEEIDRRILFMEKGVKEEEPDDDDMIEEVQSTSRKRRREEGNMTTSPRIASNLAQEYLKRQREQNRPLAEESGSASSSTPSTSRPSASPSTSAIKTKQQTHAEKEKHIPSSSGVPSTSVVNDPDHPDQENSAVNEVSSFTDLHIFVLLERPEFIISSYFHFHTLHPSTCW
ncbi:hypothetical protein PMAYCL1PPCAC_09392, partial [Pristionchus mayeri]